MGLALRQVDVERLDNWKLRIHSRRMVASRLT